MNCCFVPSAILADNGVTEIETRDGPVATTVRVVDPLIAPDVAVIVLPPSPTLLANPKLPAELPIVATPVFDELHTAVEVTSCVLPSV